jgi:hypothetical protein
MKGTVGFGMKKEQKQRKNIDQRQKQISVS